VSGVTVVLALMLFRYFETPCIQLAKRATNSWSNGA
jgi:peptidoglycan/LPS O-acetylase OafA/YrhL